jgi:glyoxylase-like metal-dependent hydrolase (beta-lactamase superfamily II)
MRKVFTVSAAIPQPHVAPFFHADTSTFTYVVYDREGGAAAIIDSVLDYEPASAHTSTKSADAVLDFVHALALSVVWILETHAHADHLTAAAYLKKKTGAKVAIGRGITQVQERFKALFDLEPEFATDGSQFNRLFEDGDAFEIGTLTARVLATPGHTDDSLTYVVGNAAFVGDTVFAPGTGTARTDFPGGDAAKLYRSIQSLFALPEHTRLFLCHDYPPAGREAIAQTSLADQRSHNVHVGGNASEADFVKVRNARDATLPVPRLILPALQVNIRAGDLPPPDANGIRYLRLPLDQFGAK